MQAPCACSLPCERHDDCGAPKATVERYANARSPAPGGAASGAAMIMSAQPMFVSMGDCKRDTGPSGKLDERCTSRNSTQ